MRHQGAFYFKRADTVAGTLDNIVGTAHEPEVTVFITPGDIARVIQAVVPCFACAFGIPVIFLEKTDRFAICSVDHDLSLFSSHNKAVRTHKKPMHGFEQSITITLPPMSTLYFEVPTKRTRKAAADKIDKAGKKTAAKKAKTAAEKAAAKVVKKPGRKPKAKAAAAEEKPVKKTARKPKAEAEPKAEKAPAKRTRKPKEPKE